MDSVSHAPRSAPGGAIAAPLALARASARARSSPYLLIAAASLLLAAVSLPLSATPSYDPWAWLVWGREILHLHLVTLGGPTWKPLPVIFTTAFAPFGAAAPDLWLGAARAGGIMAIGFAALLAGRLTGSKGVPRYVAGVAAAAGLLALYQYALIVGSGETEGLLAALVLLAILRHLDGAPRQAVMLWFAAALVRPETWPFLALYAAYLWRRDPTTRTLVVALLALVGVLWFVPELWGSGTVWRGVSWARYPRAGSAALANCPFCAELSGTAWPMLAMPFKVGIAAAVGAAALWRRGSSRPLLVVLALGVPWILEDAVLTQLQFSGSDRYLVAPMALLIVAGSAGLAGTMRRPRASFALIAATALLTALAPGWGPHWGAVISELREQGPLRVDLRGAVARAGGPSKVLSCGAVQTNPSQAPLAAWTLDVPLRRTESSAGKVLIQLPGPGAPGLAPATPRGYRLVAASGSARLFERC